MSMDDQKSPEKGLGRLTRRDSTIRDNMTLYKCMTEHQSPSRVIVP